MQETISQMQSDINGPRREKEKNKMLKDEDGKKEELDRINIVQFFKTYYQTTFVCQCEKHALNNMLIEYPTGKYSSKYMSDYAFMCLKKSQF